MKKASLIISILIFLIPAIIGICLFIFPFGQDVQTFTKLGLVMIGVIGLVVRLILLAGNKRMEKLNRQEYENSAEHRIIESVSEALEEAKKQGAQQEQNKKIKCEFCKCTYDSFLDKCPNCGAPPNVKIN